MNVPKVKRELLGAGVWRNCVGGGIVPPTGFLLVVPWYFFSRQEHDVGQTPCPCIIKGVFVTEQCLPAEYVHRAMPDSGCYDYAVVGNYPGTSERIHPIPQERLPDMITYTRTVPGSMVKKCPG